MKKHRTDGVSLTFGVIFMVIVGAWLFGNAFRLSLPGSGWFAAGALIMFGLLGLVGVLRSDRRRPGDPDGLDP